jgi:hypothetical protein
VANDSIRGAASAATRIIEQQAQAASPARISDSVKQAGQQAAKAVDSASAPLKDAVKEMPKQAKAIAQLALIAPPYLAPAIVATAPFRFAATGLVAVHKAHVQMAKAIVSGHKEVAAAASTLSKEQKLAIATNPGFVLLPPGIREMAIAGEIKRQAAKND